MEILILNEKGKYSAWVIEDEFEKYYNISLSSNRAIISAISKKKIYWKDNVMYSDYTKKIKEIYNFAFASFRIIKMD